MSEFEVSKKVTADFAQQGYFLAKQFYDYEEKIRPISGGHSQDRDAGGNEISDRYAGACHARGIDD